jgi:hypothetical protein
MKNSNDDTLSFPQQSLTQSVFYHFLPGLCILLFYLIISPWVIKIGFNPSFGVILGFVFVGIPLQLFIMLRVGVKVNKSISLSNVIFYRKKIPFWQYIAFSVIFIFYAVVVSSFLGPFNEFLLNGYFSWLPNWFTNSSPPIRQNTSQSIIVISFIALFLIDGLINPIIEEIYFRGFLLPRISRYRIWSPLINAILFSLAHFWQPWNTLQIFILVLPLYYLVWWKKNIYISITIHCLANIIGGILTFEQYLSG